MAHEKIIGLQPSNTMTKQNCKSSGFMTKTQKTQFQKHAQCMAEHVKILQTVLYKLTFQACCVKAIEKEKGCAFDTSCVLPHVIIEFCKEGLEAKSVACPNFYSYI